MGGVLSGAGRFLASYDQKGLGTLNDRTRELAWFAKQSYSRNPPTTHPTQLGMFTLVNNNPTVKVYKNDSIKLIVISIRGTQISDDYSDIEADIRIALGSEEQSSRFMDADRIVNDVIRQFPGYKIILTGHSLGGGLVYRLADKYKSLTGEVFNPAVNVKTLMDEAGTSRRIRSHIIHGDPVSGVIGRPLRNAQVYSPGYDEERGRIERMPILDRLKYLHALDRFPRK
jgi:pimeloyl-ACP methyl ester carboxylesterase